MYFIPSRLYHADKYAGVTFLANNLLILLLAIVFTPILGDVYEIIIGRQVGVFFWGPSNPEYIEGFFMGFVFFITFILYSFGTSMKNYVIVISLIPFIFLDLLSRGPSLWVDISLILLALVLAKSYLFIKTKLK